MSTTLCGPHPDLSEPGGPRLPLDFWERVQVDRQSTCWLWVGSRNVHGYGQLTWAGRTYGAHRVAYMQLIGPIPAGLELDHLCRVRACCRPSHLEPVTGAENRRRSPLTPAGRSSCTAGHPWTDSSTVWRSKGRDCRICHRERGRRGELAKRTRMQADPQYAARELARKRRNWHARQEGARVTRINN